MALSWNPGLIRSAQAHAQVRRDQTATTERTRTSAYQGRGEVSRIGRYPDTPARPAATPSPAGHDVGKPCRENYAA